MRKNLIKVCAVICGLFGIAVLVWVFLPIFAYEITSPPSQTFLSPLATDPAKVADTDYTKASNWFPDAKAAGGFKNLAPASYKLTIPILKINKATVLIGGEDLAKSLIQYPGTALPGQIGNATIFGHSVLPSFYDPTNYLTIFSLLPTLVKGDIMMVDYDGITYKYQVEEKFEVEPTDIGVLDQDESDSFLSLITCVPPGLDTRRLIVKARIIPVRSM